jgi:hypothetical protein
VFRIELRVAEGVNFPYYVMGKAQLRILPFADPWVWLGPQTDPYGLFAQEYGAESSDAREAEGPWYDWLSRVSASCPDDARGSLKYCSTALHSLAERFLPEYLSRWPGIHAKLMKLLRDGPSEADLSSALRRNERLFGLSYPDGGRETFHFNHFPTIATQKPGPHFVFGLGCLSRREELLQTIESEVGLTLLGEILTSERVASYRRRIESITRRDHYARGYGSLLEALNNFVRAIERRGAAVTLDDIGRKPGEQGYQRIVESLLRSRHLWGKTALIDFVCTSLDELL